MVWQHCINKSVRFAVFINRGLDALLRHLALLIQIVVHLPGSRLPFVSHGCIKLGLRQARRQTAHDQLQARGIPVLLRGLLLLLRSSFLGGCGCGGGDGQDAACWFRRLRLRLRLRLRHRHLMGFELFLQGSRSVVPVIRVVVYYSGS